MGSGCRAGLASDAIPIVAPDAQNLLEQPGVTPEPLDRLRGLIASLSRQDLMRPAHGEALTLEGSVAAQ